MHHSRVRRIVEEKRAQHPELRTNPSWPDLMKVLEREEIAFSRGPLPGLWGMLTGYLGRWTVFVSTDAPTARTKYIVLHELGHLWCHQPDRWSPCFTFATELNDAREDEADVFAGMIMNPECWQ